MCAPVLGPGHEPYLQAFEARGVLDRRHPRKDRHALQEHLRRNRHESGTQDVDRVDREPPARRDVVVLVEVAAPAVQLELGPGVRESHAYDPAVVADDLGPRVQVPGEGRRDGDHAGDEIRLMLDQLPGRRATHRVADGHDRLADDISQEPAVALHDVAILELGQLPVAGPAGTGPVGDPALVPAGREAVGPSGAALQVRAKHAPAAPPPWMNRTGSSGTALAEHLVERAGLRLMTYAHRYTVNI